jgi:trans-L-3-hydroxyproline dehydratase
MNRITTVDVHVAGEPLRVITGGFPEPEGHSILEKREFCRQHLDHFRRALILEPRGHEDMYGALPVTPTNSKSDFGVLFLHNEGYSTMCGHGIIGLVTVLIEEGMVEVREPETTLRIETPSGLVTAVAHIDQGRVQSVAFRNVPSFVLDLDQTIDLPGMGLIRYDLAFGGAFYVFCQADKLGLTLTPSHARSLANLGMRIKKTIGDTRSIEHPAEPDLGFLYGIIFVSPPTQSPAYCRHVCIFADGAIDRSPTGTGVSAHLAILAARGRLTDHTPYVIESILGTTFTGKIVDRLTFHGIPAIIPEVKGNAYLIGKHELVIDPDDPLQTGFRLS